MNFFLDCEFCDLARKIISFALVSEDGKREFYEVVEHARPLDEWVIANVIPILDKPPLPLDVVQDKLKTFCSQFPGMTIIADHINDLFYFSQVLDQGKGKWVMIQPLTFIVDDDLSAKKSKKLHNALFDARALCDSYRKKEGLDPLPFG